MKLIELEMKNFRQHLDSRIAFSDGVTGIIGSNGAGKSTILEAVAWALYGAPAVRGTNDTIRSKASEGGAKANVTLTFELNGTLYRVSRTLDASGKTGTAVLETEGRPLRSGMSEVSDAMARLLGMDYRAFFTSFFTGQKQLEFMSQLDGRARGAMISRMLGYDRVTKARDQANEDRKGLQREIEGLEKGLADPEDLKTRKNDADARLAIAGKALENTERAHKTWLEAVEKLKPAKEVSDQKAKRHDELTRRLEIDRSDVARMDPRLAQLRAELAGLDAKQEELDSLVDVLGQYEQAKDEYKKLAELQKHEGERQRLSGRIAAAEQELRKLDQRAGQLGKAGEGQALAAAALAEGEKVLAGIDGSIQLAREQKVGLEHSLDAQMKQFKSNREEVQAKKAQIAEAGAAGSCPTCERPLADELPKVLANFDDQISRISGQIEAVSQARRECESDTAGLDLLQTNREKAAAAVEALRSDKAKADALVVELRSIRQDIDSRSAELSILRGELEKIPGGFDQARFRDLHRLGEELRPVHDKAIALRSALDRVAAVRTEIGELTASLEAKRVEIGASQTAVQELAFSPEAHEKLSREFEAANAALNAALVQLERQRGEVSTATAILNGIRKEEESYKSRLEQVQSKRSERIHLQAIAEALDKLRVELNDRIRPELESIASELLSTMTDGRYNVLEINDNYQAMIRDDGELKPVISGGEDDIVNLALRLAISQMIADRAGQSFSLLVLDEVFGSLDDVRRDNVIALLQNLKHRFEQIILITHIESIHDAVDNCMWVEFDEKTKTSRLTDRSREPDPMVAGLIP